MTCLVLFLMALIAYLFGSIPFGLLIARAHGIDLRTIGSGNIGATNVARALGKRWAYLCFALDAAKGLIPMLITKPFVNPSHETQTMVTLYAWLAIGCAAIVGHLYPVYLRFKGGKGVATSFGVAIGFYPYLTLPCLIALITWLITVLATRYVSLASMAAAASLPVSLLVMTFLKPDWELSLLLPLVVVAFIMAALIILRHRENIKRLLNRTESKVLQRK